MERRAVAERADTARMLRVQDGMRRVFLVLEMQERIMRT